MRLLSVNTGKIRTVPFAGKDHVTAIGKQPQSGPVPVAALGLRGDEIGNPEVHGGSDQAVYAYGSDDYAWWHSETDREFHAGQFGENLTIESLPTALTIGDRLLIGTVILEVTGPRIPCSKLGAATEDERFPNRFAGARRPGAYFRVLNEGDIEEGMSVEYLPSDGPSVTTLELFDLYYDRQASADRLEAALSVPLAERLQARFQAQLARLK